MTKFGQERSVYEAKGQYNNRDYYYSEESGLYIFYRSGFWLFATQKGSLNVIHYAVSGARLMTSISKTIVTLD